MAVFPTGEWVSALKEKLNNDEHYGKIASKWEGDMRFIIEPDAGFPNGLSIYLDLWHGKCRDGFIENQSDHRQPAFTLKAPYGNFARVIRGDLDPMQALMTRKLGVQGNMAVLMRNVPVVLDFVRCCREITTGTL